MMSRGKSAHSSLRSSSAQHFGDFSSTFHQKQSLIEEKIWWRQMHFTVHGDPGTAVAAVYDMHARAHTHTHTYTYTNRRTALQRAQDGAWATKHHSVRPPLTMIEIFFGAIRVARYHEELHWNNTYYQIGWISLELPKNGTATQHREVQRNKCYPDKLRR